MLDLEAQLELPSSENARLLEGVDLSTEETTRKIEELEIRLADKEELLLEKELVLEEVSRLCARAKKKADTGKEDTLSLAKKVNDFQSRIKQTTRKMMAIVSELSMNQAKSLQLQQAVKEREAELEQCRLRMERGEYPNEEIEREWKKMEAAAQRKDTEKQWQRQTNEEMEQYELANGVYTTAEPRPNAYIPEGELPLPKPYGAHAPFKPSEPGAAMRHLRKPVQKPIEL
jgi:chromosome segregation ATPase